MTLPHGRFFPPFIPCQAVFHNPFYNSNKEKQNEFETLDMQAAMEPLFQAYKVNLVLNGHVHDYERTYPVFQFDPTPVAPVYVLVGTGADSVHDNTWLNKTRPTWSAYRNGTQWGTGTLIPASREKMVWRWHWNLDGILVAADEVTVCNTALGYPANCEGLKFQCAVTLRGMTRTAWTTKSAQLLVNLTSTATGVSASQMLVHEPFRRIPRRKLQLLDELMDQFGDEEEEAADAGTKLTDAAEEPLRALWAANRRNGLRGAGLRVDLEAFGLPGFQTGNTDAASADAEAIEAYLNSAAFVAAFGNGVTAASVTCEEPRFGTVKL